MGTRLWERAIGVLRGQGFTEMFLWVLDRNAQARRFYERQGARAAEHRSFEVGGGTITEVAYRLSLA